ncbi:Rpn family recombination-promoting nuclease/putative transposase [Limosilactobacillus ingluviei]|uniref:Rpn family recombination-promoting nuclease/putative transposase n=1 Tax=Limosilactobacillus ingluviei TaxID=148604 RepID=UPI00195B0A33|nr:Rpn family recombination-promoting nuclease/putative transposase [Limosilactobacillus ingluviei]MBM6729471.1 Rpn family recombination-promoting nuclease/putative transposase [Limosilactobacillus ingluviei]
MAQEYFDFTNDLIFCWVMEHEENCLAILRAILPDLKITAVKRRENEHPVNYLAFDDERGVRFDAIIEDDQERFYDVEMQVANQPGLGNRVRYYQAQLDQETLKKGEDYDDLRESYVIFFCAFDPCGQDRRLYQFHYYEDVDRQLRLPTNSHVILINALGTRGKITPALAAVLDVMNRRRDNQNPLAVSLVKEIDGYNRDKKRRRALMNLQMRLKDERRLGLSEGRAEGRAEGRDEMQDEMTLGLIHALQAQGMPQKQIVEALALTRKISLAEAQHYYEQVAQADSGGEH